MQINGALVKVALQKEHIRQSALAKSLRISQAYLSMILCGRRPAKTLIIVKLAKILNVDPRMLVDCGWRPSKKRPESGSISTKGPVSKRRPTSFKKQKGRI